MKVEISLGIQVRSRLNEYESNLRLCERSEAIQIDSPLKYRSGLLRYRSQRRCIALSDTN